MKTTFDEIPHGKVFIILKEDNKHLTCHGIYNPFMPRDAKDSPFEGEYPKKLIMMKMTSIRADQIYPITNAVVLISQPMMSGNIYSIDFDAVVHSIKDEEYMPGIDYEYIIDKELEENEIMSEIMSEIIAEETEKE